MGLGQCWQKPGPHLRVLLKGVILQDLWCASDSLQILVPDFLKKGTQFTRSLNWFQASNLLVYWFQVYGFTYAALQMAKTCLKRCLFDDKNAVFVIEKASFQACFGHLKGEVREPYTWNQYTNRLEAQNQFQLFVNWVHFLTKFGTNLCKESLAHDKT